MQVARVAELGAWMGRNETDWNWRLLLRSHYKFNKNSTHITEKYVPPTYTMGDRLATASARDKCSQVDSCQPENPQIQLPWAGCRPSKVSTACIYCIVKTQIMRAGRISVTRLTPTVELSSTTEAKLPAERGKPARRGLGRKSSSLCFFSQWTAFLGAWSWSYTVFPTTSQL